MTTKERHVYTIPEAGRVLRIGRSAAYEAARRGEIPTIRLGRSLRVPRAALERLLAGEPADDQDEPADLASGGR
jgi:excisionase family DNA binding protein